MIARMADATDADGSPARIYAASHLTGTFTLRSGVDERRVLRQVPLRGRTGAAARHRAGLAPLVPDGIDALAGLELGGVPLATMLSQVTGCPLGSSARRRRPTAPVSSPKAASSTGARLCIVEDVVTSGGAVLDAACELRARGAVLGPGRVRHRPRIGRRREARGRRASSCAPLFTMTKSKAAARRERRSRRGSVRAICRSPSVGSEREPRTAPCRTLGSHGCRGEDRRSLDAGLNELRDIATHDGHSRTAHWSSVRIIAAAIERRRHRGHGVAQACNRRVGLVARNVELPAGQSERQRNRCESGTVPQPATALRLRCVRGPMSQVAARCSETTSSGPRGGRARVESRTAGCTPASLADRGDVGRIVVNTGDGKGKSSAAFGVFFSGPRSHAVWEGRGRAVPEVGRTG